ncbi:putative hydrolase [Cladorrhinum samala]|uniref:Hydrolase n=1 Tax=Cladorrhinum samala TaxID=585594 RepID=A0AAV9HRU9_9PEZI|nr:putative hydrolase [Cladorrhinum samala]
MIDHVLGRPSVKSRRLQVLAVLAFWSAYLFRGNKNGPPLFRFLSRWLTTKLTAWQTFLITLLYLYSARNFSTLVGLASPDPLANMYDATYFRATWVLTALDAGFWTAMKIRQKWLRDIASVGFSLFYMVAAEKADEKVRKVRGNITVDHLRVSWNKGVESPYLRFLQGLMRPRFTKWPPRAVRIPRPSTSDYKEPVLGWLYFDGPLSDLKHHNRILLDIPGGGFVAMDPRSNDDKLFSWAAKTGLPILSLDYKKAPEYPYPYALNECYDVYCTIIKTKGRCIGLSGDQVPKVVITGDSAGGTLATATTIMIIESGSSPIRRFQGQTDLPVPAGLVLFYPALDMNIGSWMSDEQMALIKDRRMRGTNKRVLERKTMQYNDLVGTPHQSDDEDDASPPPLAPTQQENLQIPNGLRPPAHDLSPAPQYAHMSTPSWGNVQQHAEPTAAPGAAAGKPQTPEELAKRKAPTSHHPEPMRTRLAMSSMISYFNDRVLTPEMMRAMIILYVGPHNRPDFSQDYLLCPILAPDVILARFPKTYFLTGERDPLVDDTVIFAGRLRRVKAAQMASDGTRYEYRDTDARTQGFDENDVAEVALIPGISHGFLQFPAVYPPAWGLFEKTASWVEECFERKPAERKYGGSYSQAPASAVSEDDGGLEISMGRLRTKARGRTMKVGNEDARGQEEASDLAERGGKGESGESSSPGVGGGGGGGGGLEKTGAGQQKKKKKNARKVKADETLVKRLASSDDLLGRRMQGLAAGLTGLPPDAED